MQKFIQKHFRLLSMLLLLTFYFTSGSSISMAIEMNDLKDHWAAEQVQSAVDRGYVKGYENNFRPDDYISRVEFITLVNRYFGYTKEGEITFFDVSDSSWYSKQVKIAELADYTLDTKNGLFRPEQEISREEVVVMLANVIKTDVDAEDKLGKYVDSQEVTPEYTDKVNTMVACGYFNGRDGNKLCLKDKITRAEAVALIQRVVGDIYDQAGVYGDASTKEVVEHNVLVNTQDITLRNLDIKGDLYLSAGINDGDVTLDNVIVHGKTVVEGGGINSIILNNTVLEKVEVNKIGGKVRLLAKNNTRVNKVKLTSGAKLEEAQSATANGFKHVDIAVKAANQEVSIDGSIDEIAVGEGANAQTEINMTPETVVKNIELEKAVKISKTGNIQKAVIKANGVKLEQKVKNVQMDKKVTSAQLQGKRVYNAQRQVASSSGSSSGGSSSKKKRNNNSGNKQPVPQVQLSKINIDSQVFSGYLVNIAVNQSIEQTVQGSVTSADKKKMYFVQAFEDSSKGLMFYFGDDIKTNQSVPTIEIASLPKLKKGIYSLDEGNVLELESENIGLNKKTVRFVAGDNDTEKLIHVGKYLFSIPGRASIDTGIKLSAESEYFGGLTLNLKDTKSSYSDDDEAAGYSAVFGTDERFEKMIIENNTFDFGEESAYVTHGIRTFAPTKGKLLIKNNIIKGNNIGKKNSYPNNSSAAISITERIKVQKDSDLEPQIEIIGNHIKDTAYHGIAVTKGDVGKISILDNKMDNIGQNALIISKFGGYNNIDISGNVIESFGTRKIMKKKSYFDPTVVETNGSENGIWYQFVDDSYGVRINNEWLGSLEAITKELNDSNEIASKKTNDALAGVLDSTVIGFDRADYNFENPETYINTFEAKYSGEIKLKDDLVIYKANDENATYGYDSNEPGKKIKVKSLTILGPGAGKVRLSGNLIVEGDLVVDLPNANLLDGAKVNGKKDIKRIKSMDASNAEFTVISGNKYTVGASEENGLLIEINNVNNSEEKKVEKSETTLAGNIEVILGGKIIDASNYTVDDVLDRVTIKKVFLDTLKENTELMLTYKDDSNKVSLVQSAAIVVTISDGSAAEIGFGEKSSFEFTYKAAPDEGAKIYVKNVKDKFGKTVAKEDTVLAGNVTIKKYNKTLAEADYTIDDDNDVIIVNKSFLDTMDSTSSGVLQSQYGTNYDLIFKDESNHVNEIKTKVEFKIINRSNAIFEFKSGDVFTNGNAPESGIVFAVTDIKNYKGESISAKDSNLTEGAFLKTFPFDWANAEKHKGTGKFGIPKIHYEIDDDNDTITVKKSYLDTLKLGTPKLDNGRMYFTIEYYDPVHFTEIMSPKLFIAVKAVEEPRSTSTLITSKEDVFEVITSDDKHEIKGKTLQITSNMSVGEFTGKIKRDNERQRLRVYGSEDILDGKIIAAKKNNYKADYMSLYENDVLLVTAEDGLTEMLYTIEVKSVSQALKESVTIKDADVVSSIEDMVIRLNNKVTISKLEEAIEVADGVTISFETKDNKPISNKDTMIDSRTRLVVSLGDDRVTFKLVLGGEPVYRALLVGNWDYPGDKQDLVGPHNDLNLLEKTMKSSRFDGDIQIKSIVKVENRLKAEVFKDIENTFRNAKDNDVSYFYYSGHGTRNKETNISYLCTVSEDTKDFISVHELERELSKIPGKKVVILDSCNSGGFIDKEFVASSINDAKYYNDAIIKSFQEHRRDYLNGNDFKVLTASSSNEFSYESKVDKLGKFTKALCEGGGLDGKFLADADKNNEVTLMEAYKYLDREVSSTSHIQVYPYNDEFVILGNTSGTNTALNKSTSISAGSKYEVINDTRRAVMSKDVIINDTVKVKDFLANIVKDHEGQVLEVYPAGTQIGKLTNKRSADDKLVWLDLLLVRAEDGSEVFYQLFVKKADTVPVEDKDDTVLISSEHYTVMTGLVYEVRPNVDKGGKIDVNTTVEQFLSKIKKGHDKQKLYVFGKDKDTNNMSDAKSKADKMVHKDQLLVLAEDGSKKVYTVTVSPVVSIIVEPDEKDSTLDITSDNYVINIPIIGDVFGILPDAYNGGKIDTKTSVEQFLSKITKGHKNQTLYVFAKDAAIDDKKNAKANSDKMADKDKLVVVAEDMSERVYTVTVKQATEGDGSTDGGSALDGTITIDSDKYKVSIITNIVYAVGPKFLSDIPNANTSVETFINNINKGHEKQKLYVFSKGSDTSDFSKAKAPDDKMVHLDILLVVAENGNKQAYNVTLTKGTGMLEKPTLNGSVKITSSVYKIIMNEAFGNQIVSDPTKDVKIDTNMTVETFLSNIEKNHSGQTLHVYAKGADTKNILASKDTNEKMVNEDILVVLAQDNTMKEYKVYVSKVKEVTDDESFTGHLPDDKTESTTSSAGTTVKPTFNFDFVE